MKKILLYTLLLLVAVCAFSSCSEDKPGSHSIFVDEEQSAMSEFDRWLETVFMDEYNIRFMYKYEDVETDFNYNMVPIEEFHGMQLASLIKLLWLEPNAKIGGVPFVKATAPRIYMALGNSAMNSNNTETLGVAEGGVKISFYAGNRLSKFLYPVNEERLIHFFVNTMHHEAAHILQQTVEHPRDFNELTPGDFTMTNWHNLDSLDSYRRGFVSNYARSQNMEDFVETYSHYVTLSDEAWNQILTLAGETGSYLILKKLGYVKDYFSKEWNIDVDAMRAEVRARFEYLQSLSESEINDPLNWNYIGEE